MIKAFAIHDYKVEYNTLNGEYTIIDMDTRQKVGTFPDIAECGSWFYSNIEFDKAVCIYEMMESTFEQ